MLKTLVRLQSNIILLNHGKTFPWQSLIPAKFIQPKLCPLKQPQCRSLFLSRIVFEDETKSDKSQNSSAEKRLKVLQLEVDIARQEGRRVPDLSGIKEQNWEHLLSLNSRSARLKYLSFLWQIERKKEARKLKKEKHSEAVRERKEQEKHELLENDHIIYGLSHTCMFLRIYDATINHWHNNKLINAMKFGEKIVIDCSYDEYMNRQEAMNTAKQLTITFAENRNNDDPFDLHFCNFNTNSIVGKQLERNIPTIKDPDFPLNIYEGKCFTEIFPKENLVYLTPHCRTELLEYNPDDIYIIGAMVDKTNNEPISLAKAKRLGLRMAKLPLDRYLQWGAGSGKSLTLNQMINILLDIKKTGDWNYALRHVPRRKLIDPEEEKEEIIKQNLQRKAKSFKFDVETWGESKKRIPR